MAPINIPREDLPTPENQAAIRDKIDALRDIAGKQLRKWDREFLDSIEAWLDRHGCLTVKQREGLDEVHYRHLG